MKGVYGAIIRPRANGNGYDCLVPDLPGCISSGYTLEEAFDMIQDAANFWLLDVDDEGKPLPVFTPLAQLEHEPEDICTLIHYDTDEYRSEHDMRTVRKNVSLPAWLANKADKRGINVSKVLQDALIAAM